MLYEIEWSKEPYYKFSNLKSINIDHSKDSVDINIKINEKKEYDYKLVSKGIRHIEFCIGYNKQLDKAVFFKITYLTEGREKIIYFYLPRKYNKTLIQDFQSFALNKKIPFKISKSLHPLLVIIPIVALILIIGNFALR